MMALSFVIMQGYSDMLGAERWTREDVRQSFRMCSSVNAPAISGRARNVESMMTI
jgi:hypothetical protein